MKIQHNGVAKVQPKLPSILEEFNQTKALCIELLKTKHYQSLGEVGVFAIVQKAQSLGIGPLEALNGGMYFIQGKVEMQSILMAKLIRAKGHSITLDKNSDHTVCILHGKRKDNGDTWKVSFSIEDAKRAGIYKQGGPWSKYPDIMCYNRALSKLARQLFPDVIGNCYVEGEISDAAPLYSNEPEPRDGQVVAQPEESFEPATIGQEQVQKLSKLLFDRDSLLNKILHGYKIMKISDLPADKFDECFARINEIIDEENSFLDAEVEYEVN